MEKNLLRRGISTDLLADVANLNLMNECCDVPQNEIHSLLEKTLLIGGKRLRPLLTFLVADLFCLKRSQVVPYAKAIELVHAASLSHDDVIDNAKSRRSLPSINIVASNKKAVLVGDYLLSQVIVDLCNEGNLKLVSLLSKVIQDLALGEWLQLGNREKTSLVWGDVENVAKKKTASVISFCCQVAPIISSSTDFITNEMKQMGESLGIAFQFVDDVIDFSSQEVSGKDGDQDLENQIVNSVAFEFFQKKPELYLKWKESPEQGRKIFNSFDNELRESKEIIFSKAKIEIIKAKKNLDTVYQYLQKEISHDPLIGESSYYSLNFLMDFLLERTF